MLSITIPFPVARETQISSWMFSAFAQWVESLLIALDGNLTVKC